VELGGAVTRGDTQTVTLVLEPLDPNTPLDLVE